MNEIIEDLAIEFLTHVYDLTPHNVLQAWGMKRYSRFKTKCWKHLQESTTLDQFTSRYFEYYPVSLLPLLEFLDAHHDDIENFEKLDTPSLFAYINQYLPVLVGRMQKNLKEERAAREAELEVEEVTYE